jgi:hypothetical protein
MDFNQNEGLSHQIAHFVYEIDNVGIGLIFQKEQKIKKESVETETKI